MKFIEEDISSIISDELRIDLENNANVVNANIKYLKDLGVENSNEVFKNYYPIFLMDPSNFQALFNKYDMVDLIDKIKKNVAIIEYL